MHKFSYFFGLVLLSLFACEPAGSSATEATEPNEVLPTAEEGRQAIEQLVRDAFDEVWSACDTTALDRLHTTDFVLLEHGEVWTNDTIKKVSKRPPAWATQVRRRLFFSFFSGKTPASSLTNSSFTS